MRQIRIIAILLLVWNSACGAGNIDKFFLLSRIGQMFPNENKMIVICGLEEECGYMISNNGHTYKEVAFVSDNPDTIYYAVLSEFYIDKKNKRHVLYRDFSKAFRTSQTSKLNMLAVAFDSLLINNNILKYDSIGCRRMPATYILIDNTGTILHDTHIESHLLPPEWVTPNVFWRYFFRVEYLYDIVLRHGRDQAGGLNLKRQKRYVRGRANRYYQGVNRNGEKQAFPQAGLLIKND